jgi:REP element-mobilizing transposase RayT
MRLRRLEWIYKDHPIYYLTLVAQDRKWLFANPDVHEAFIIFGQRAIDYGIAVGRYALMPDHLHVFAAFGPDSINLSNWVKSLKNSLSKCLRQRGIPSPHWQKDFFDHTLRSEESYHQKWEYMRLNPVRAGLVDKPDDWPFQGEIYQLEP